MTEVLGVVAWAGELVWTSGRKPLWSANVLPLGLCGAAVWISGRLWSTNLVPGALCGAAVWISGRLWSTNLLPVELCGAAVWTSAWKPGGGEYGCAPVWTSAWKPGDSEYCCDCWTFWSRTGRPSGSIADALVGTMTAATHPARARRRIIRIRLRWDIMWGLLGVSPPW